MTHIAFHAGAREASLVVDSVSYGPQATVISQSSKIHLLPHLDAAWATQGLSDFGSLVSRNMSNLCDIAEDFDTMSDGELMPELLREVFAQTLDLQAQSEAEHGGPTHPDADSMLALVGYSIRQKRFRGFTFGSHNGFEGEEHDGLFVYPAPFTYRPSHYESSTLQDVMADPRQSPENRAFLASWLALGPAEIPATEGDWRALGKLARADRALIDERSMLKVLIAGELYRAKLSVGEVTIKRIHRFNDSGDEFLTLLAGLGHPLSLAQPCRCGSGDTFGKCCAAP